LRNDRFVPDFNRIFNYVDGTHGPNENEKQFMRHDIDLVPPPTGPAPSLNVTYYKNGPYHKETREATPVREFQIQRKSLFVDFELSISNRGKEKLFRLDERS
jgi:hypothetical protein